MTALWEGCDNQGRNRVHFRDDDLRWTCFYGAPKACPYTDAGAPLCETYQKTSREKGESRMDEKQEDTVILSPEVKHRLDEAKLAVNALTGACLIRYQVNANLGKPPTAEVPATAARLGRIRRQFKGVLDRMDTLAERWGPKGE